MFKKIKTLFLENKTFKQTIFKNAFWLTVSSLGGRLIKAIFIIFAARILGAAGYGVFSYALTLAGFFTIFSDIGLTGLITRETAKEYKPEYFSTSLIIKFFLVGLSILIVIFVAPNFSRIPETLSLFPLAALLLAVDSFRDFSYSLIRAKEKMELEAFINISMNLAITILGIFVLFVWPNNKMLLISYIIGSAVGLALSVNTIRHYFKGIKLIFNKRVALEIVTAAWPFALLGLLGTIMINTDILMIGWFRTATDLGYYSAAQRPIQLFYLLPAILATVFFPTFSRLANKDNEKFRSILERTVTFSFLIALPLAIGGTILAPQVLTLLFGSGYLPATAAFRFLMLTLLWIYPSTLIGNAIFAYNQQRKFIGYIALGALGNVIFNYLLIPPFGIAGAAFATIVAQSLVNGLNWQEMKKINNFNTLRHLPKILIATFLMALFVWGLKMSGLNFLINLPLSILFYFGILYFLKEPLIIEGKAMLLKLKQI